MGNSLYAIAFAVFVNTFIAILILHNNHVSNYWK